MKAIQTICREIGEYGCYFLSIIRAAEKRTGQSVNPIAAYCDMQAKGYLGAHCFMEKPDAMLSELAGAPFSVRRESKFYRAKGGEIEVLRYEWKHGGHFVLGDGRGQVAYDPLGESNTVKYGTLESKRIFSPRKA